MVVEGNQLELFDPGMSLKAIRDSRYKSTAHAIAELVDNSIDAGARHINILFQNDQGIVTARQTQRIASIAVLDDGDGMSGTTLAQALRFGGRGSQTGRQRIGKYGFGLPTSSMSQCRRVDVWSWQKSYESAWHCYLYADEIIGGEGRVPSPTLESPPEHWLSVSHPSVRASKKGTLVVWSKLDQVKERRSETIMRHVQNEVGRIYRHFIVNGDVEILMTSFGAGAGQPKEPNEARTVLPNDPLYLMSSTSIGDVDDRWAGQAMFKPWTPPSRLFSVHWNNAQYTIEVIYSVAKDETLRVSAPGQRAGNLPHGRHAGANTGISVVREGRELVTLPPLVYQHEEPNRWWGCEVKFSSGCDDLFGVDHNKQMAVHFQDILEEFARIEIPTQRVTDDADQDNKWAELYKVAGEIRDVTAAMYRDVSKRIGQFRSNMVDNGHKRPADTSEGIASEADKRAELEGLRQPTEADRVRKELSDDQKIQNHQQLLMGFGYDAGSALAQAERIVREDIRYKFVSGPVPGSFMFQVSIESGVKYITLNIDHPMYSLLEELEDEAVQQQSEGLSKACVTLRLLLASWAAAEEQYHEGDQRRRVQAMAHDWGRQAELAFETNQVHRGV